MPNLIGDTSQDNVAGVLGNSSNGTKNAGPGVHGTSAGAGVFGESETWHGVAGLSKSTTGGCGVFGQGLAHNIGVLGQSDVGGVEGRATSGHGVFGQSTQGQGVHGRGPTGGLFEGGGVAGVHAVGQGAGPAILAEGGGNNLAGFFNGDVTVTRKLSAVDVIVMGADCAECFPAEAGTDAEPGTVMAIGCDGRMAPSSEAYDRRVAGIVTGAGDLRPGIVLGHQDGPDGPDGTVALALAGRVYCKVDASFGAIEIGDLLTTSPATGRAMRAGDPARAFGAIVGKALAALREGQGLLPVLVALQ
jgi:hypothetical protein